MGTPTFLTALLGACLVALSTQAPVNETHPSKLIMGGTPSQPGAWPSWVSIVARTGSHRCGGTLISNRFVLTAAHCLLPMDKLIADYQIAYGTINPYYEQNSRYANIKGVIVHREYNVASLHYDVAIIELDFPIQFDLFAQPIALTSSDFTGHGGAAVVVGFGTMAEAENQFGTVFITPGSLQQANVNIVHNNLCQEYFNRLSPIFKIMPSMMCAGTATPQGGTLAGVLKGDSGGPLYAKKFNGDWYQIGIVSFNAVTSYQDRLRNYYPSGFIRVSVVCPFIYTATKGAVRCQ